MATVVEYDAATNFLTTDGSTRVSNSFTPTATGQLLVVPVIATGTVAAAATVTAAANGVSTFTLVSRATFGPTLHSVYIFVANQLTTGTSAMTVTFDCTADPHTGAGVMVAGVNGMSKVGSAAVKQFVKIDNGAGASTPSFVFSSSVLTYNATIYALGEISTGGVLTPASWTQGHSGSYSTPTTGGAYGYRNSGFASTTVTWPGTETAHGGVFVELDTTTQWTAAGTVDAVLTAFGEADLLPAGPVQWPAAGQVDAVSGVSGAAAARLVASGSVAATTAVTGATTSRLPASGTVAATSAATGAAAQRFNTSTGGTVAATTTATGSTLARLVASGLSAAVSALVGAATALLPASGAAAATSTAFGAADIYVPGPVQHPAAGTVAAVSGTYDTVGLRAVASGSVAAVSGATGTITTLRLRALGTVAGTSTAFGTIAFRQSAGGTVTVTSAAFATAAARLRASALVGAVSSVFGAATLPTILTGPAFGIWTGTEFEVCTVAEWDGFELFPRVPFIST